MVRFSDTRSFKYDPFGRRIYKSSSSGTIIFAYDRQAVIEETDASGAVVARYSQSLNIDEPLAVFRLAATSYYHTDGLGSVTSLSNSAGAIAQSYGYDTLGRQTSSSGSLTNPFQYTAREFDPETNLYYYRARYYDTNAGRFVSEDPAGFGGGLNVYAYVKNDPVDFVDPTGLKCWQSSPWTQIPQLWGPNGPAPYLTLDDGLFWVRTGWSYGSLGIDKTHCVCTWVADHTRVRKFYRVPVKEQENRHSSHVTALPGAITKRGTALRNTRSTAQTNPSGHRRPPIRLGRRSS
jgi:RHS repeat-associated protein